MFMEHLGDSSDAGAHQGQAAARRRIPFNPVNMAVAAVLGGVIGLTGCSRTNGEAQASTGESAPPAAQVSVVTLASQQVQQWDEFNGRIEAVEMVQLRPRVSGYIERIGFTEGQDVRKGQVMFTIDQRPYKAALASAQAQLERARAAADLAQTQSQRAQDLVRDHAISREEADNRSAALTQALANVRALEADVSAARLQLEFTEVKAPITGRAGRAQLTVGNLAQADQSVLTSLASQDPVYVYFDADENTLLRAREGAGKRGTKDQTVKIALANETGFAHQGVLNFTDNQLDPATGTIRVRALLRNPDQLFTPGMFARVQMQNQGDLHAMLIDDKAVLTDQNRQYVYVVGEGNRAERRDLKLGRMVGGKRVVLAGLKDGDQLVVGGLQRIYFPGMPIAPQPAVSAQQAEEKK